MKDVQQFLVDYPRMVVKPNSYFLLVLQGYLDFEAYYKHGNEISDSYHIKIDVPYNFPRELPKVRELDNKIPRDGEHHINSDDDSLCLGSPLRLHYLLSKNPSLIGFTNDCLIPFLYGISYKQKYKMFPNDELKHGNIGLLDDYMDLLKLSSHDQVIMALKLLGKKKRLANKYNCPCGCKIRLGECRFHFVLNEYRNVVPRTQFKQWAKELSIKNNLKAQTRHNLFPTVFMVM